MTENVLKKEAFDFCQLFFKQMERNQASVAESLSIMLIVVETLINWISIKLELDPEDILNDFISILQRNLKKESEIYT